jgi:hypothetical protein
VTRWGSPDRAADLRLGVVDPLSRRPLRWLEALLLTAALALVSMAVFRRTPDLRAIELIRGTYVIVPLLIWAALRFEQRGTTAALILVAVIAVTATSTPGSYFAARTPHEAPADDRLLHGGHGRQHADAGRGAGRTSVGDRCPRRIHLDRVARAEDAAHGAEAAAVGARSARSRAARRATARRRKSSARAGRGRTTTDRIVSLVDDLLDARA